MRNLLIISILTLLLYGCKEQKTEQTTDCPYGAPQAILMQNALGVSDYTFEATGQNSTETAMLSDTFFATDSLRFTLLQSGCETVRQEFQFELPAANYTNVADSFFVQRVAEGLRFIAERNPQSAQTFLPNFAAELFFAAGNVPLGQPLAVDSEAVPKLRFVINKVVSETEGMVSLELFEE
jgi:hypothetical protein